MKRQDTLTGLVTSLTRNKASTDVRLLTPSCEAYDVSFSGLLGSELQGQPVLYHERHLHGRTYQVIEPRLADVDKALNRFYTTRKN